MNMYNFCNINIVCLIFVHTRKIFQNFKKGEWESKRKNYPGFCDS